MPLPSPAAQEIGHILHHLRVGLTAGNDLHQPHVARRIEEMGDQEVAAQLLGQALRHLVDRQAAGIGGEDRRRREIRGDLLQELELDRHILDDDLDHPVAGRQFRQVILQVADLDLGRIFRQVERRRLHFQQPLQAVLGDAVAHCRALEGQPPGLLLFAQFLRDDVEHKNL